ncbi:hypothetical protein D9V32_03185 [Mycetocola tolaasinivorans]|uniref:Nucleotidyl transferase AbiEii/AbiGii toxin family protein n=1 Tax=Mycetocola tolaasinivorans TaxID=76635 RepID=A0A3L7ABS7_9MICO|nr:hypothetical protein [Mycetocola tolaasinivorans]RLP77465.1 hypothetical protein D9V32_03185 [Mycetocola tolaasinivorans]
MTIEGYDPHEAALRDEAGEIQRELGLGPRLARIGRATVVGSVALRVVVARDLDLTVAVDRLDGTTRRRIAELAAELLQHERVREVLMRDDTGTWNTDPSYPDGIYLRLVARAATGHDWSLDIWFVDEPGRQPDLAHLATIGPRIDVEAQAAILTIKRYLAEHPHPHPERIPSFDVYRAVLNDGVREPAAFLAGRVRGRHG